MKFAKELDQDLVPEWRLKYLNYKLGKKHVKDITRALAKINQSPRLPARPNQQSGRTPFNLFWDDDEDSGMRTPPDAQQTLAEQLLRAQMADAQRERTQRSFSIDAQMPSAPAAGEREGGRRKSRSSTAGGSIDDRSPLRGSLGEQGAPPSGTYGSVMTAPAMRPSAVGPPSLELPDPVMNPEDPVPRGRFSLNRENQGPQMRRHSTVAGDQYEVGRTHTPSKLSVGKLPKKRNIFHPRRTFSMPYGQPNMRRPFYRRLFSKTHSPTPRNPDAPIEAYRSFDLAQAAFFNFLDSELYKVEEFYKMKEQEATERFEKLHEQLRIMRDRRVRELITAQQQQQQQHHHAREDSEPLENGHTHKQRPPLVPLHSVTLEAGQDLLRPLGHAIGIGSNHVGKNSKALQDMVDKKQREAPSADNRQGWSDYSRHPIAEDVPYRVAKRKLKLALQEYYRGLELLKSYALLNRTAFRKLNKKYDKAVMARPPYRYMSEHVNKAWFVVSERVERLIVDCEDLYARYFERGNHKLAVSKLRSKIGSGQHSSSTFRNGLMLACGLLLGAQGTVNAFEINQDVSQPAKGAKASYLLQLYGGYSLVLLLFLLFSLVCRQWTRSKINYVFIFEFDTRHVLDWRQLAELPCMFTLLLGLVMFLNFNPDSPPVFFEWWPVVLLGVTLIILFFPLRIFYWRSRGWMLYSLWRLLFAGVYAVEFRDFFLGDMFCSLTYTMGNIEVFFCLYAEKWTNLEQCNSSNSRLLGFFSTLPGIWRALQCIRRYYDTRNWFPHLVNCGKYTCTILFYIFLSAYRINRSSNMYILFVFFGVLNSIYVSIWDLVMDWSLCNPHAPNKFLRKDLGYKSVAFYYTAMVIDPILRFNWLMYVILPVELQHSAVLSFLISVSEVMRRAMWSLLRVENEHCTNVGRFRASRDVPLPYELENDSKVTSLGVDEDQVDKPDSAPGPTKAAAADSPDTPIPPTAPPNTGNTLAPTSTNASRQSQTSRPSPLTLRRRRTLPPGMVESGGEPAAETPNRLNRVGTILANAHAQDFERRRKPERSYTGFDGSSMPPSGKIQTQETEYPSSDEDDEEEVQVESARLLDAKQLDDEMDEYRAKLKRERSRKQDAAAEQARERGAQVEREAVTEAAVVHQSPEPMPMRGAPAPHLTPESMRSARPDRTAAPPETVAESPEEGSSSKARGKAPQRDGG